MLDTDPVCQSENNLGEWILAFHPVTEDGLSLFMFSCVFHAVGPTSFRPILLSLLSISAWGVLGLQIMP